MEHVGMDLGKRGSQIAIITEAGELIEQRLRTERDRIARRRGKRVAMVALARKLSGILYAMWRDDSAYDPARLRSAENRAAEKAA